MLGENSGQSWTITITSEKALNFALYVGCSYGFISKDTYSGNVPLWPYKELGDNPDISLSMQWENWWEELIQKRNSHLSQGINSVSDSFNPPEFTDIKDESLRHYCKKAWPLYSDWWGMPAGGASAMAYWESFVAAGNYVYKFERLKGRKGKNFRLHIDLVYTGISKRIELRPEYVIMPIDTKYLKDESWWMGKLQQIG